MKSFELLMNKFEQLFSALEQASSNVKAHTEADIEAQNRRELAHRAFLEATNDLTAAISANKALAEQTRETVRGMIEGRRRLWPFGRVHD